MSDPRRLLDDSASEFESRLLVAGQHDGPSAASRRRVMAGLGFGGALSVATVASTAEASSSGWLSNLGHAALKHWGISAALSGAAVWAGVTLFADDGAEAVVKPKGPATTGVLARPPAPVADVADIARVTPVEPKSDVAPLLEPEESAIAPRSSKGAAANKGGSALSDELAALESSRRALVAGDAKRTLVLLDDYARKFPKARLGTEASVLRIEALMASGDKGRARRLAKDFLTRHTNGPYERRVRSLMVSLSESGG